MNKVKTVKITCQVDRSLFNLLQDTLKEIGVYEAHHSAGRSAALKEKDTFFKSTTEIDEDPLSILSFYVPEEMWQSAYSILAEKLQIGIPGRGTILVENVELLAKNNAIINLPNATKASSTTIQNELVGICCIVQRGEGNDLARAILDLGLSVPAITFGIGTGLRDKLGLLRITIPAEKEVLNFVVNKSDLQEAMNTLIEKGRLDQPGKGFIYEYPLRGGVINTKTFRGKMKHAASIEQIIAALDGIKQSTEWRQRDSVEISHKADRKYLNNLVTFSIYCNEGKADDLVTQAMNAGAAGATISKINYLSTANKPQDRFSPAREMAQLIIGPGQIEKISKTLEEVGLFTPEFSGFIEIHDAPRACTYLR